jgi:hypothetical protein
MHIRQLLPLCLLAIAVVSSAVVTAEPVPFKGSWSGETKSAVFLSQTLVSIVAEGSGQLTHLGAYTMVSPHTSDLGTGFTEGDQIFTAANGDTLTAYCAGPADFDMATGIVIGALECEIESGTGRFEGATGSYEFSFVSTLLPEPLPGGMPGFATEATITGEIDY